MSAISSTIRQMVRQRYGFSCGYCGVSEIAVGGELQIDHFRPLKHGGTDSVENLVYACAHCNRYKASYWPDEESPDSFYLLHPLQDDFAEHIALLGDGRLTGISSRGWFHISWLHLNRPQLIVQRQERQTQQELQQLMARSQQVQRELKGRIQALEQELAALQSVIEQLTR